MVKSVKMPSAKKLLNKKKMYSKKKEEVWVYLEREMKANSEIKPYNQKVGDWLKFLKELKEYYRHEEKKKLNRLKREVGPAWYIELSPKQKEALGHLGFDIHSDSLQHSPKRTRRTLLEMGVHMKVSAETLLRAIAESSEDAGSFIWNLYKEVYKTPPTFLKRYYDLNAMILMSSMVFLDLEETLKSLDKRIGKSVRLPPPEKPKPPKYSEPKVKYGEYLSKMYVPLTAKTSSEELKKAKPPDLGTKVALRSEESYENILKDTTFLKKRVERHLNEKTTERVCNYKFWEPPAALRCSDPKMAKYLLKLKMVKLKARAGYMKLKPPLDNIQFHIGTVAYINEKPCFMLHNIITLPTGYIPLNNGDVTLPSGELVTHIGGYWRYPRDYPESCDAECECMKWESKVMKYINESKCKCGHFYDYYNEGKPTEKYFYQPSTTLPHFFDYAKVYQMDPMEDFIKDTVREAVMAKDATPIPSRPNIDAIGLKDSELTAAFLADLADTPLLIPHLPESHLLQNLQAHVRKRVKGPLDDKTHLKWKLKSQKRWVEIDHVDFRGRAYFIPFSPKQVNNFNWSHRGLIQQLCTELLKDFLLRNQTKQVEQARLLWPTMRHHYYKNKNDTFLKIFYTYFPGRVQDIYMINPYDPNQLSRSQGGKTCPLKTNL